MSKKPESYYRARERIDKEIEEEKQVNPDLDIKDTYGKKWRKWYLDTMSKKPESYDQAIKRIKKEIEEEKQVNPDLDIEDTYRKKREKRILEKLKKHRKRVMELFSAKYPDTFLFSKAENFDYDKEMSNIDKEFYEQCFLKAGEPIYTIRDERDKFCPYCYKMTLCYYEEYPYSPMEPEDPLAHLAWQCSKCWQFI